jgi:hypothetical protein
VEKGTPIICGTYFYNFHKNTQSNESPNGRKFAQSGHPAPLATYAGKSNCNMMQIKCNPLIYFETAGSQTKQKDHLKINIFLI